MLIDSPVVMGVAGWALPKMGKQNKSINNVYLIVLGFKCHAVKLPFLNIAFFRLLHTEKSPISMPFLQSVGYEKLTKFVVKHAVRLCYRIDHIRTRLIGSQAGKLSVQ